MAQKLREWIEQTIAELAAMGHFVQGFGKGVGASLSWGTVEAWNPQPTDTPAETAGEIVGTAVVGGVGTDAANTGTAVAVAACGTSVACAPVGVPAAGVAVAGAAMAAGAAKNTMALMSAQSGGNNGSSKTSPNQMQKQVERGQAPKSVDRVDLARAPHEKAHVTFKDGSALNHNGTWKHGGRELTNREKQWLQSNGWELPK